MKIAIYQMDIVSNNPVENRKLVETWIEEVCTDRKMDILVLPEMWTTAYALSSLEETLEKDEDGTVQLLQKLAKTYQVNLVAGSIAVKEGNDIYNRALVITRSGDVQYQYDKIHLVPMLDEHLYLTGGKSPVQLFELDGRKMGVVICYDLRFPELIRSLALQGAEVVFVLAEWPVARVTHWEVLQQARAIENQVFIVSCNRVGVDDGVEFAGTSMVVDPWGDIVVKGSRDQVETLTAELNLDEVSRIRKEVPIFTSRVPELYE